MLKNILLLVLGIGLGIVLCLITTPKPVDDTPYTLEDVDNVVELLIDFESAESNVFVYEEGILCRSYYHRTTNSLVYVEDECYTTEELLALGEYYLGGKE